MTKSDAIRQINATLKALEEATGQRVTDISLRQTEITTYGDGGRRATQTVVIVLEGNVEWGPA